MCFISADTARKRVLVEDGKTGFLFEPGNSSDFAEKIKRLLTDDELAAEMSENGLKKDFTSVSQYCEKLLEIYK